MPQIVIDNDDDDDEEIIDYLDDRRANDQPPHTDDDDEEIIDYLDDRRANDQPPHTDDDDEEIIDYQTPVAGTSGGARALAPDSLPPPLTPEQQQSMDKMLGVNQKRKAPEQTPKQHDLRSRSAVSTSKATFPRVQK